MPGTGEEFGPCPHCGQLHSEDVLLCPNTEKLLPLEGRILDGKFKFVTQLGEGGMGAVWKATNVLVKKTVAIKLMHVQFSRDEGVLARFRNEATAAGRIGSKYICDILDLGKSTLGPYIVMEMLKGQDLAQFVQSNAPVDHGTVVMVVRQALEGLGAAHEAGIVHRDLKPENIFLHQPEPGQLLVKLMDFGISKFTEGNEAGKTGMGVLMGTPEYMSPEQTEGAAQVDLRTDIWAMGVILYWALTGRNPFMGPTMAATLMNVSMREAPSLAQANPNLPADLVATVEKCMSKVPEERWNSCAELSAALAPYENLQGGHFVPYASRASGTAASRPEGGLQTTSPVPPGGTVASAGPPIPAGPPPAAKPPAAKPPSVPPVGQAGPTFSNELGGAPNRAPTLAGGFAGIDGDDYERPESTMGRGIGGLIAIGVVAVLLLGGGGYLIWLQTQKDDKITQASKVVDGEDDGAKVAGKDDGDDGDEKEDEGDEDAKEEAGEEDAKEEAGEEDAKAEGEAEAGEEAEAGAAEGGEAEAGAAEAGEAEAGAAEAGEEAGEAEGGDEGAAAEGGDAGDEGAAAEGGDAGDDGAAAEGGDAGDEGAAAEGGGDEGGGDDGGGDDGGASGKGGGSGGGGKKGGGSGGGGKKGGGSGGGGKSGGGSGGGGKSLSPKGGSKSGGGDKSGGDKSGGKSGGGGKSLTPDKPPRDPKAGGGKGGKKKGAKKKGGKKKGKKKKKKG